MKLTEFKIDVYGSFSDIKERKEFTFIKSYPKEGFRTTYYCYELKKKGKSGKYILSSSDMILKGYSKSIYYKGHFLGNITQYEEGFLADVAGYLGRVKMFKTTESAEKYMISCRFETYKNRTFNLLGRYKFAFTLDYLEGMNAGQIAEFIREKCYNNITNNEAVKIAKKFLKTNLNKDYVAGLINREDMKNIEWINTARPYFN